MRAFSEMTGSSSLRATNQETSSVCTIKTVSRSVHTKGESCERDGGWVQRAEDENSASDSGASYVEGAQNNATPRSGLSNTQHPP
jgi:hypothetical protein